MKEISINNTGTRYKQQDIINYSHNSEIATVKKKSKITSEMMTYYSTEAKVQTKKFNSNCEEMKLSTLKKITCR